MRIVQRQVPEGIDRLPSDLHPVVRRVLAVREVRDSDELDHSLRNLLPFAGLMGIDRTGALLADAVRAGRRILVVGDYDADGATGCAVAVLGLRSLGATDVRYLVPDRFTYGYGLTPEIVAVALEQQPALLVTVDNGISSLAGVRAACAAGVQVIVTDHHLAGSELPPADAIVNPNQPGDAFPSKCLAGVGVMFYVLSALRAHLRECGWFEQGGREEPNLAALLDLVAIGTVADVVPLDHNNRILVAQGLRRIRAGRCRPGVRALLRVAGREAARVVSSDLGFSIAPRLNAAGRLTDMSLGIACLLSDDDAAALEMANRLDELNRQRRAIESEMHAQASHCLEEMALGEPSEQPFGVCLFDPRWHPGVVGILASRIKERLHRPVIVFAPEGDGEGDGDGAADIKGSGRSIAGLHIRDALDSVAARHPGLITRFGGHAMAAGLSIGRADFERFAQAFDEEVRRSLDPETLEGVVYSDGELQAADFNLSLARGLRDLAPWGQGFPEPVFDGRFDVIARRIVGGRHLKLKLGIAGHGEIEAIAFGTTDADWAASTRQVRMAYRLDVNHYRNRESLQLVATHVEPVQ